MRYLNLPNGHKVEVVTDPTRVVHQKNRGERRKEEQELRRENRKLWRLGLRLLNGRA